MWKFQVGIRTPAGLQAADSLPVCHTLSGNSSSRGHVSRCAVSDLGALGRWGQWKVRLCTVSWVQRVTAGRWMSSTWLSSPSTGIVPFPLILLIKHVCCLLNHRSTHAWFLNVHYKQGVWRAMPHSYRITFPLFFRACQITLLSVALETVAGL